MEQEEKKEMVRFSGYIDKSIVDDVQNEAKRENRKFNWMVGELLSVAIKERKRLRNKNAKKKNHSESDTADPR